MQFSKAGTDVVMEEPSQFNLTQQEWEAAVANAEDESDVLGMLHLIVVVSMHH